MCIHVPQRTVNIGSHGDFRVVQAGHTAESRSEDASWLQGNDRLSCAASCGRVTRAAAPRAMDRQIGDVQAIAC